MSTSRECAAVLRGGGIVYEARVRLKGAIRP